MAHNDGTFTPRGMRADHAALSFVDRFLTPIAVGVLLIGVAVFMVLGPGRGLLAGLIAVGGNDGPITAEQIQAGLIDVNAFGEADRYELDRQIALYTIIPERPRDKVVTYTIKPGDSLFGLADLFRLDPNTIFWSNSDILGDSVHTILPGIELFILPVDGVYHLADGEQTVQTIATEYNADPQLVIDSPYNELEGVGVADRPPWGMRVVVPGGERDIIDWRPPIVETTDAVTGAVQRSFMPGMAGSCGAGITGSGGSGGWISPVPGATFTQSYYPGHSGVDLAAVPGTPVLAADSGVVVFSGWVTADWGYGVLVVLDHGNGWTTYYAHLTSTTVGCGQFVSRGGQVGTVGSTGNSSGPHLHFEMRWNHTPDNPGAYVGF